jgi:transposase
MEQLGDGDGPIDIHDYRHGLKLIEETRETSLWNNKQRYACPACGKPFEQLFISEQSHNTFNPGSATPFCIRHEADRILMFRH